MSAPFRKILVANRGEIAVRVARACREMGIATVAVFSDADRDSLHVRYADEAYPIGPPAPAESYLRIDTLLEVARRSGAEAIHPGYGFLSENPNFAEACGKAGVIFIGPPARAMEMMGNKIEARRIMKAASVPITPGSAGAVTSAAEVRKIAGEIGYPILIKAAAGGGGRGMRVVRAAGEIESALTACRSEAEAAFGDSSVYVERYAEKVRHIEVQVLADAKGNTVHLGERECSIQRRHQKLIEESPSPAIDDSSRARLCEAAVRACEAIGYRSAGTVEFLADGEGGFSFMEVNARLQVEHPVTEMVTGIDLVKAQIRIAAGEALALRQDEIRIRGASIECRLCAEDPDNHFLPSPGRIDRLRAPGGPGVRDDSGVYEGYVMPPHYDSLFAKLIVWGETRLAAIERMRRALDEYVVEGIPTTLPFHRRVMSDARFVDGDLHTRFIEGLNGRSPHAGSQAPDRALDLAAIAVALAKESGARRMSAEAERKGRGLSSGWRQAGRRRQMDDRL
ncbi:MAG: acetyl-CoA carboxylase biotin carboxylase subunit [Acidobacteria bacterium]|nr:acetyl-CoA carboxylase biotin carboxylase subunit [Acidobacteriota bacterium]